MKVLALVTDLIFASRINGEAKAVGVEVRILRKAEQVLQAEGDLLLADLNLPGAAEAAGRGGQKEGRRVVGFVSHMDAAAISAAKDAGIQEIVARSRFIAMLPDL